MRTDYKPNESIYTIVINNLALAKDFDGIEQVMKKIKVQKSSNLPDGFFYNVFKIYDYLTGHMKKIGGNPFRYV